MQTVTRKELAEVIGEKTMHLTDKSELTTAIAAYLMTAKKSVDIDSLMRDVMQFRQDRGIIEAVVVCAHPIDERVMKDIEDLLKQHFPAAKTILIDQRIDESLVGGVRIELPQENLDLSIKSKLNLFKRLASLERN